MTSPEVESVADTGHKTGAKGATRAAVERPAGHSDDVSFKRSTGTDQTSDKVEEVTDVTKHATPSTQDIVSQLQAKASEFTSNLLDRANVEELTKKLEAQVREHPARALLMVAGAGFLLGRAAKK